VGLVLLQETFRIDRNSRALLSSGSGRNQN
jgi:hypothetical protein